MGYGNRHKLRESDKRSRRLKRPMLSKLKKKLQYAGWGRKREEEKEQIMYFDCWSWKVEVSYKEYLYIKRRRGGQCHESCASGVIMINLEFRIFSL